MAWSLEAFTSMDFSAKSSMLSRTQRKPHKPKVVKLLDEGIRCPLKSGCDKTNYTLEGIRQNLLPSAFEVY